MKLKDYISPLLKWWWLIAIATAVAGVSSYYATLPQPPIYQAQTTLIVGRAIFDRNPSNTEFGISQQLAQVYADFAMREQVRNATMAALGLTALPEYVARVSPGSQVIEIAVTDVDPVRAQVVANELARQLILESPTSTENEDQERMAFVQRQLDDLQAEIDRTQEQILTKQEELKNMTGAVQIADAQAEINALQSKQTIMQTNYAALLANTDRGAVNSLSVIEPASLPAEPIGPNKPAIILLVSAIGFVMASGAAHLLEGIDKTLKTPEDVQRVLNLPVLGYIGEMERGQEATTYVAERPRTPIAEAFRALRTNIEFAAVDRPIRTILVTSGDTAEGKTTIAANLALIIAQADKRVALVDTDLRRPSVHRVLNVSVHPGLSEAFRGLNILDTIRTWKDRRVSVITAGRMPPNPAELLGSRKMDGLLANLKEVAEIVIIDGPPMVVTDATVLASKVDAVLLVVRPGQTREDLARAFLEQMGRAGARVIGVALNRLPRRAAGLYGGYAYYSPYYANHPYYSEQEIIPDPRVEKPSVLPTAGQTQPVKPSQTPTSRIRPPER
jgi:capsular exopolysaccharide synthesis family protein